MVARWRFFAWSDARVIVMSNETQPSWEGGVLDLDDGGSGTQAYVSRVCTASLATVLGHADRASGHSRTTAVGLLSAEGRKSVEPLAAVTAPGANPRGATSIAAALLWRRRRGRIRPCCAVCGEHVLPSIIREELIQAWII